MNENLYLMWLSRIERIGFVGQKALLDFFKSGEEIFFASKKALQSVYGITEQMRQSVIAAQKKELLETYQKDLDKCGCRFVSILDEEYPYLLQQIPEPPIGFYVSGKLPKNDEILIGVIGCRECTPYGQAISMRLSGELAYCGAVIVSGMARGIDTDAHRGALKAKGKTIAVLAGGIDMPYPPENWQLIDQVKEEGCVISEYPPKTKPQPRFFPVRNRIISGLSRGIIVVEAGERSGTSITVGHALDQGREVMAIPGHITSPASVGTNALIKQGATLVTTYEDVLNSLGVSIIKNKPNQEKNNIYHHLAPNEKLIYDCINSDPITVDTIINKVASDAAAVNYTLTILEMKQCIKKVAGQKYIRL